MTKAPERIWAHDAQPDECNYIGGGWWDDACGNTQYPHMVEYVRADLAPQWQAIETAPKNGVDIIVTDGIYVVTAYYVRRSHWASGQYDLRYADRQVGEEPIWFEPTQWMHVKPPKC